MRHGEIPLPIEQHVRLQLPLLLVQLLLVLLLEQLVVLLLLLLLLLIHCLLRLQLRMLLPLTVGQLRLLWWRRRRRQINRLSRHPCSLTRLTPAPPPVESLEPVALPLPLQLLESVFVVALAALIALALGCGVVVRWVE